MRVGSANKSGRKVFLEKKSFRMGRPDVILEFLQDQRTEYEKDLWRQAFLFCFLFKIREKDIKRIFEVFMPEKSIRRRRLSLSKVNG